MLESNEKLEKTPLEAKTTKIDPSENCYRRLFDPRTETMGIKAGSVVLMPAESVGRHSTESSEEILIVLDGEGRFHRAGGAAIPMEKGSLVYCPPNTEHDVENTGSIPLRYIFVVAPFCSRLA